MSVCAGKDFIKCVISEIRDYSQPDSSFQVTASRGAGCAGRGLVAEPPRAGPAGRSAGGLYIALSASFSHQGRRH